MRVGLLGAGRIGRIHGLNVAARADAELVAVTDAVPAAAAALAAETGAKETSAEAILSDGGIDAILICTPTDTHADLIEAAVSAGKAVFCEKPVDLDAARIRRCLATVETSGRFADDRLQPPLRPELRRPRNGACAPARPERWRSSV